MTKFLAVFIVTFAVFASNSFANEFNTLQSLEDITVCEASKSKRISVKGYYRKNGTYVRPHTRRRASR